MDTHTHTACFALDLEEHQTRDVSGDADSKSMRAAPYPSPLRLHRKEHVNHESHARLLFQVKTEVLVEDEEEIAEGDLITIRVTMTRTNLEEGERAPPVHAPYFPTKRKEGWYLILAHNQTLIMMEKVFDAKRTFVHELKCFGPGASARRPAYPYHPHCLPARLAVASVRPPSPGSSASHASLFT